MRIDLFKSTTLIILLILVLFLLKGKIPHRPFNSEAWKNWEETEMTLSLRWDMMNHLRMMYDLEKMNKSKVIELLGEPSSKSKNHFRYYLGHTAMGINTGSLVISFDLKNDVINFYVTNG